MQLILSPIRGRFSIEAAELRGENLPWKCLSEKKLKLRKLRSNGAIVQGGRRLESAGEMTAKGAKVGFLNGIFFAFP